ncbi:DNA helicase/exodeoxyribonuclease V, beta subunit [Salegentibacter agarivorans]|uniref:RecBCD enzyme subunit RecB n=1 Tax=Salegentibacter agarivorans TaxID=345907 RepID=A0A1I2MW01_9FLAO|nr:UvrD-helicase domain-containing protein [Salegentibacter agarivorans]SFF95744.1 DNA helicase/exodeoxyribonuclease V, beta subunit [Salegentibacter agarivorans]
MAKFNVLDIQLKGKNLVEASAGTGKTYSIAILVLRLLLEEKKEISRILMVTFTNKAVGELADRVRKFVKIALKYLEDPKIKVELEIKLIIDRELTITGRAELEQLLKSALYNMDEAPIQTIDSFAGECLTSYAFETGRPFGQELITDYSEVVETCVQKFWRENIANKNEEEYVQLKRHISLQTLQALVYEAINAKEYIYGENILKKLHSQENKFRHLWAGKLKKYLKEIDDLDLKGFREAKKEKLKDKFKDFNQFITCIRQKDNKTNNEAVAILFPEEEKLYEDLDLTGNHPVHALYNECIKKSVRKIYDFFKENNLITYKQILDKLHDVLEENDHLQEILSKRYDAVFIDEFQDTNRTQYEIYDQAFGKNNLIFYIGDPKQSIYGFRGADLHSYTVAAAKVDHFHTMDVSFRSTEKMTKALNIFFKPSDDFDTFHTAQSLESKEEKLNINYIPVSSGKKDKNAVGVTDATGNAIPLRIFTEENKDDILYHSVSLVKNLLGPDYLLNNKRIKPSDIGILVRNGYEGEDLKHELTVAEVKAITMNDNKIFSAKEAKSVSYLLEAVENPNRGNINRALLTELTKYSRRELLELDEDSLSEMFRKYRKLWFESGVYALLRKFMDEFGVVHFLMKEKSEEGLRSLSNLTQIAEVLQQEELHNQVGPTALLKYLNYQISSSNAVGDEYEQRIESDEDAVQIYNIHKAKGLQFPIVIAPYLDLDDTKEWNFNTFRDPVENVYKFYAKGLAPTIAKDFFVRQNTQENRRLLYVTLTRAEYNCFLFRESGADSALKPFVEALENNEQATGLIEVNEFNLAENVQLYKQDQDTEKWGEALDPGTNNLKDKNWRKMSFSGLSSKGPYTLKENSAEEMEEYDKFIFKEIPGGKKMGNLLHELFENIDFDDASEHKNMLEDIVDRYYPEKKEELAKLEEFIPAVLKAKIKFDEDSEEVNLHRLGKSDKICELEFDFLSRSFKLSQLRDVPELNGFKIYTKKWPFSPEGMLTGFVDLLFRQNEKFYILDWKSNYLGDSLEHYEKEDLVAAMNENNYHLQYLIYTVAVKRFLESRLGSDFDYSRDFGGVIYMFLRGNREGEDTGVFTTKPSFEQVQYFEELFYKDNMEDELRTFEEIKNDFTSQI